MRGQTLTLIVNPCAGGGRTLRLLPAVRRELADRGLRYELHVSASLSDACERAGTAVSAGGTVAVLGGDGTVSAVAGALAGGPGTLAILPGGRGNDFAAALGVPADPVAACALLDGGVARAVDIGYAGERPFLGIASCGLDSLANAIAARNRLPLGRWVYAYGGVRALLGWKPATFTVTLDGAPRTLRAHSVAVANSGRHGGGMRLAPGAEPDDGQFDVVLVDAIPKAALARALPLVFSGRHVELAAVTVLRGREVQISADRALKLYADGGALARLPATLTLTAGAVSVLSPPRRAPVRPGAAL